MAHPAFFKLCESDQCSCSFIKQGNEDLWKLKCEAGLEDDIFLHPETDKENWRIDLDGQPAYSLNAYGMENIPFHSWPNNNVVSIDSGYLDDWNLYELLYVDIKKPCLTFAYSIKYDTLISMLAVKDDNSSKRLVLQNLGSFLDNLSNQRIQKKQIEVEENIEHTLTFTEIEIIETAQETIVRVDEAFAKSIENSFEGEKPLSFYTGKEELFTKNLLKPLFKKMGFIDVKYTHGPHEFGKDLVFYESDKFNRRRY